MSRTVLVLGGARSGKSAYAEGLAARHRGKRIYLATAEPIDTEMEVRIGHHRKRRGDDWVTIEASLDLVTALKNKDGRGRFILVDCITIWIGSLMHHERAVDFEISALCDALGKMKATVVLVSNEVGSGIVPDNALARAFRDEAGRANQALAAVADEVVLVVAGQKLILKKLAREARRSPPRAKGRVRRA